MNIFILEDNFLQQTRIENIVKKILVDNKIEYRHFEVYGKPQQLLEDISERGNHQLFLLDIEIKDDDKRGLDVAREIRKLDSQAVIAFVTSHSEFMPVSFEYLVSAIDFIDKELFQVLAIIKEEQYLRTLLYLQDPKLKFKSLLKIYCILKHQQLLIS